MKYSEIYSEIYSERNKYGIKIKRLCNDKGYLEEDELGNRYWYNNKKQPHRKDGPAIEYSDGNKSWYYHGKYISGSWSGYTQEDFERYLRELKIKEYW